MGRVSLGGGFDGVYGGAGGGRRRGGIDVRGGEGGRAVGRAGGGWSRKVRIEKRTAGEREVEVMG